MALSNDIISQFAKVVNNDKKTKKETVVYGKTIVHNGEMFVQLDGSNVLTPVTSTTELKPGERVIVTVKNHTATVTGNVTSPSAQNKDVQKIKNTVDGVEDIFAHSITADELTVINASIDNLIAKTAVIEGLEAVTADIQTLKANYADITKITTTDLDALNATIDNLKVKIGEFENISTDDLDAINADIENLKANNAEFSYVSAEVLDVIKANIEDLDVTKLSAESADLKYVNIDFTNIDKAWIGEFYARSGIIEDLVVDNESITGRLVGVTIKGDLIEGNTIKADKLVVQGEDGLYYKLNVNALGETTASSDEKYQNGLDGSTIIAESITAEKLSVSDLVAFGATIGGFHISNKAIYSGIKDSVDNKTNGIYQDTDGQFSVGDKDNFIRYYKIIDENGDDVYKLEISAESILFGTNTKYSMDDVKSLTEHVKIGTYTDQETGNVEPSIELAEGDTDFKQVITNTKSVFMNGNERGTQIDTEGMLTKNVRVEDELRLGEFIWSRRSNGNCGIMWKEVAS